MCEEQSRAPDPGTSHPVPPPLATPEHVDPRQPPPHSPSSQSRHTSPASYSITVWEGPCDGTVKSPKLDIRCRGQKGAVGSTNSHKLVEAKPKPGQERAPLWAPTRARPRPRQGPYRRSSQRGRACSPRDRQRGQVRSRSRPVRARPAPPFRPSPLSPGTAAAAPQNCITGLPEKRHGAGGGRPPPCWMRAGRRPAGPGRSRTEAPRALPPSPPAPRPWARPGPAARPAPHGGPILAASLARPLGLARARPKPLCYPRPRHGPAWTPAALSGAAGIYACR